MNEKEEAAVKVAMVTLGFLYAIIAAFVWYFGAPVFAEAGFLNTDLVLLDYIAIGISVIAGGILGYSIPYAKNKESLRFIEKIPPIFTSLFIVAYAICMVGILSLFVALIGWLVYGAILLYHGIIYYFLRKNRGKKFFNSSLFMMFASVVIIVLISPLAAILFCGVFADAHTIRLRKELDKQQAP